MNDDPIKLREALYAAEPFLTFLHTEATVDRNSKHLEDALNKVRGALGMPLVKRGPISVEIGDDKDEIHLVAYTENEDGSCNASFDLTGNAPKLLMRVGLLKLLTDAAKEYAGELDEDGKQ